MRRTYQLVHTCHRWVPGCCSLTAGRPRDPESVSTTATMAKSKDQRYHRQETYAITTLRGMRSVGLGRGLTIGVGVAGRRLLAIGLAGIAAAVGRLMVVMVLHRSCERSAECSLNRFIFEV